MVGWQADLIFIPANFSRSCVAGKRYAQRQLWDAMLRDEQLWGGSHEVKAAHKQGANNTSTAGIQHGEGPWTPATTSQAWRGDERGRRWRRLRGSPLKLVPLQYGGCGVPWNVGGMAEARKPNDIIFLIDRLNPLSTEREKRHGVVVPFVVSSPSWLVGEPAPKMPAPGSAHGSLPGNPPGNLPYNQPVSTAPHLTDWVDRKLLFLAGHIPKLYISPLRYLLWRQLRSLPNVTVQSSTLACTVGAFSVCHLPRAFLLAQNNTFFTTHCLPLCRPNQRVATPTSYRCGASERRTSGQNLKHLLRSCNVYAGVNFTEVRPLDASSQAAAPNL